MEWLPDVKYHILSLMQAAHDMPHRKKTCHTNFIQMNYRTVGHVFSGYESPIFPVKVSTETKLHTDQLTGVETRGAQAPNPVFLVGLWDSTFQWLCRARVLHTERPTAALVKVALF